MTRWLYRSLSVAILAMLSFSQAYAFESPSGLNYLPDVYAVDWTYTEPIVSAAVMDSSESVAAKIADNLTDLDLACTVKQKDTVPISYSNNWSVVSLESVSPQRGYITPLRS